MHSEKSIWFEHKIVDSKNPQNPHLKGAGDINGDGFPDIIGGNWSGDYQPLEIWENKGSA